MAQNDPTLNPTPSGEDQQCPRCSAPGPHEVVEGSGPHPWRIVCAGGCGIPNWWQKKPLNAKKRSDKNTSHRARWKEAQGDLICHWCLVKKDETRAAFHIDHIKPLEFGGVDEFRNTRPLCAACHTIRHALISYQRTLRGKTARSDAA